jgi:hypothetical protein
MGGISSPQPRRQQGLPNAAKRKPPISPEPPRANAVEETLDLATQDLAPLEEPAQSSPPPRAVDKTLSISAELIVEPTSEEPVPAPKHAPKK